MLRVGMLLFEDLIGKKDTASSRIRGNWLIKYWPGAERYVNGKKYDVIIYQKVYLYKHAQLFDGIKILDICDPDFYYGNDVVQMIECVDAVTVPTQELKDVLDQVTDKPVVVIPDRHDPDFFKEKKIHIGKAKEVVWYGYSHNANALKQVKDSLARNKLNLSIISNEMVTVNEKQEYAFDERFTMWKLNTVNKEIVKSDFMINPFSMHPLHRFKSNNRTVNAWFLKMPVAKSVEDMERFIDPIQRQKEADKNYKEAITNWTSDKSVAEYKNLIKQIQDAKTNKNK